jgi:hypothetical protein
VSRNDFVEFPLFLVRLARAKVDDRDAKQRRGKLFVNSILR